MRVVLILLLISSLLGNGLSAQATIDVGKTRVAVNELYVLTLRSTQPIKSHDAFPELNGLIKRTRSSSSTTNIANGRITSEYRILQYYAPKQEGSFKQAAFSMRVNGQAAQVGAFVIAVVEAKPVQNKPVWTDPFAWFNNNNQPQNFVDVEDDAFFALTVGKNSVYVGEGVPVTIGFYVAEANQAPLQFYQLNDQITQIIKKIKPTACWEENFNIQEVEKESLIINNKPYAKYTLYEAMYYPLREEALVFPSVGLKMLKYKVAQQPSFFGRNRQENFKTFYARPRTVEVKPLPPHPLRDVVAVGQYRLAETITKTELATGESFTYTYNINGQGNISAIQPPNPTLPQAIKLYSPEVRQQIERAAGRVYGAKNFTYHGTVQAEGTYPLEDYMSWVYFDPVAAQYDTLRPQTVLLTTGENVQNQQIATQDPSNLYALLAATTNVSAPQAPWLWTVLALATLGIVGWIVRK